ncbi:MAG TPA: hypothetical protein VFD48_04100 [Pyrinomonadaceae bacterium]|jgi:hypothetical protein|nr:hypothetical protein [Pyrinomonadaceae bacterium]
MKRILYALYAAGFTLALTGGVILLAPPTTVYACTGSARCEFGESVSIPIGATSCSCVDNDGCTWVKNGVTYSQKCAKKGEEELSQ